MFGFIHYHSIVMVQRICKLQPQPDQLRTALKYKDHYQNDIFLMIIRIYAVSL